MTREEESGDDREHRYQQADGSPGRSIPTGGEGRDQERPEGPGDPEGQIVWPDFAQVVGVLYELAVGLFGAADNPFPAFEIANRGLLESAIGLPHQPYYESFYDKLAAMVRSIAANHPLRDGNKRLAVTVLHSTLLRNGFLYFWDNDDAVELALRCASGETDYGWLSRFIEAWTVRDDIVTPMEADAIRDTISELDKERDEFFSGHAQADQTWRRLMAQHARGELPEAIVEEAIREMREFNDARRQQP
jgi:death on curing protein